MKNRFAVLLLTASMLVMGMAAEAGAVLLKTTVTATIASVRGDSPLKAGDQVTFTWTYDVSSTQMHRFCDDGATDCIHDETNFTGFDFMSDARLSLSDNLRNVLPVPINPVRHLSSHETVVYGGEIGGSSVFRFVNRCDSFYLSLFYGGSESNCMIVFKKDGDGVYGIGYEFADLQFSTTLAGGAAPDPETATSLLSRAGILRFAGSRHRQPVKK
jgi:hypothetical protein